MRPNRLVTRAYLSRGARLWLAVRAMTCIAFVLIKTDPLRLSPVAVAAVIALCVLAGFVDANGRRRERALLGNLGVTPLVLGAFFAAPALAGEVALALAVAALSR